MQYSRIRFQRPRFFVSHPLKLLMSMFVVRVPVGVPVPCSVRVPVSVRVRVLVCVCCLLSLVHCPMSYVPCPHVCCPVFMWEFCHGYFNGLGLLWQRISVNAYFFASKAVLWIRNYFFRIRILP
jgi:hypothetical protein